MLIRSHDPVSALLGTRAVVDVASVVLIKSPLDSPEPSALSSIIIQSFKVNRTRVKGQTIVRTSV